MLTTTNSLLKSEIEEHKRDRAALADSEQKYRFLVENMLTGIYMSRNGRIIFCNEQMAEMFGYEQNALIGKNVCDLLTVSEEGVVRPVDETNTRVRYRIVLGRARSGRTLCLKWKIMQVRYSGRHALLGNLVDITEQKEVEETLRRSERDLHQLSKELLQAQENERKRIACELHDCIGQSLSSIKFSLEHYLQTHAESLGGDGQDVLRNGVSRIRNTIEEVRAISMNLRPSMLDDLGLVATLEWFIREYRSVYPGLSVTSAFDIGENDIPDSLKVVIFRIVQEACNNIAKHADATEVILNLERACDGINVCISDNGKGFAVSRQGGSAKLRLGFGLKSMSERAESSGGTFCVVSYPGAGTRIHVSWPNSGVGSMADEAVLDRVGS